jgi:anthranilate phosphoribosyltransferase
VFSPVVCCVVCGAMYEACDPAAEYRSLDKEWWCADTDACTARARDQQIAAELAAMAARRDPEEMAAMLRALESVWRQLEINGWRI